MAFVVIPRYLGIDFIKPLIINEGTFFEVVQNLVKKHPELKSHIFFQAVDMTLAPSTAFYINNVNIIDIVDFNLSYLVSTDDSIEIEPPLVGG
jgi:molybdopterin converting factor small subunit